MRANVFQLKSKVTPKAAGLDELFEEPPTLWLSEINNSQRFNSEDASCMFDHYIGQIRDFVVYYGY